MGTHQIDVTADGVTLSCTFTFPAQKLPNGFDASPQCPPGLTVRVGPATMCTPLPPAAGVSGLRCEPILGQTQETITVPGTPVQVRVRQTVDGAVVLDQSVTPVYATNQPNGPGCEPTCHQAGAEWSLAPSCADYCTAIQAACTLGNQQYANMDNCMNSCKAFPVGVADDRGGDTLGCRFYEAGNAAMSADLATMHCTRAGPGGDGVCGDNCAGFCDIAMIYCTDANSAKVYDTRDACLADCAMRRTDVKLCAASPGTTASGNQIACLLYHVQEGSSAPDEHCRSDLAISASSCR
jgi:hypothetical protein